MTTRAETWNGLRSFAMPGALFELLETVNPVNVIVYDRDGQVLHRAEDVEEGYFIDRSGVEHFARVEIETSGSEAVKFLVTDGHAGNRRVPAIVSEILQGTTITNVAEATIGAAESQVAAASSTRRSLRFRAADANAGPIYLGATGITTANGCVRLQPGDTWVESDGAAAAWYAISDGAGRLLRIQEIS